MAPIAWKESYSVGIEAVDHEHRELIELVNRLQAAMLRAEDADAIEAAFGDLLRGISAHFALEERFMRGHGYDQLDVHKADHERLLDQLRDIMDGHVAAGADGANQLAASLDAWFSEHFRTHDARLHGRLGAHPHDEA